MPKNFSYSGARLPLDTFKNVRLLEGHPKSRTEGVSAMEAVAWIAGEPHTDRPQTACPFLTTVVNEINDTLNDDDRQAILKPIVPRLVNTRHHLLEGTRRLTAHDWTIRVAAPAWLELVGATDSAGALRGLPELTEHLPPEELYDILPVMLQAYRDVQTPVPEDDQVRYNTESFIRTSGIYAMYMPPDQFAGTPSQHSPERRLQGRSTEQTHAPNSFQHQTEHDRDPGEDDRPQSQAQLLVQEPIPNALTTTSAPQRDRSQ